MDIIPIISTIILIATIMTLIIAVSAYVMFRLKEKRKGQFAHEEEPSAQLPLDLLNIGPMPGATAVPSAGAPAAPSAAPASNVSIYLTQPNTPAPSANLQPNPQAVPQPMPQLGENMMPGAPMPQLTPQVAPAAQPMPPQPPVFQPQPAQNLPIAAEQRPVYQQQPEQEYEEQDEYEHVKLSKAQSAFLNSMKSSGVNTNINLSGSRPIVQGNGNDPMLRKFTPTKGRGKPQKETPSQDEEDISWK